MSLRDYILEDQNLETEKKAELLDFVSELERPLSLGEVVSSTKKASAMDTLKSYGPTAANALVQGLAFTGAGALAAGGVQGARKLHDIATRKRDLKKIRGVYPELNDYSDMEVELAYRSLRHINPHFAKDPMVGGTLLMRILRNRNTMDPSAAPRFTGEMAMELSRARPRSNEAFERLAVDGFTRGLDNALRDRSSDMEFGRRQMADEARAQAEREFRSSMSAEDRAFRRDQEARQHRRSIALETIKNRLGEGRDRSRDLRAEGRDRTRRYHDYDLQDYRDADKFGRRSMRQTLP